MTALDIGVMLIRTRMEWTSIALLGGFALIKQNKVTVLVNQAETRHHRPRASRKTYQEAQRQWVEAVGAKERWKPISPSRARARLQLVKAK
jgi:F0F1-type ATP synthase epsilon subunit